MAERSGTPANKEAAAAWGPLSGAARRFSFKMCPVQRLRGKILLTLCATSGSGGGVSVSPCDITRAALTWQQEKDN